jgi:YhcH/YjgK/YiaL family protein
MILDHLSQLASYASLHPLFAQAADYINRTDFAGIEDGKYDIAEGLRAILSTGMGKTREASLAKFECHDRHIDIQVCLQGEETIGWAPRHSCQEPNGDYNPEKDVQLYHDPALSFFRLTPGQFAIFFPEDVHAPMIGDGVIRKLVLKVKI